MARKRLRHLYRVLTHAGVWHIGLVGAAITLVWGFIAIDLSQEYRDDLAGAVRETNALARGLGETTLASFDTIDQTLKDMRDAYSRDPAHFDLRTWMEAHNFGTGLIIQASIVGPDGVVVQSNLPLAGRTDLSDREHIRVQQQSTTDEMFISQPVLGRVSNRKSLNVTRKIVAPDGSYGGAVVVSVGLAYLTRFYESLSARGVIALVGSQDGIIRSRTPVDNDVIGTRDPDINRMTASSGSIRSQGPDGNIIAYRRLTKYPLVVLVALDSAEVFGVYNRDKPRYGIAGAALTLLLLAAGLLLVRQRRRLLRSQAALTATLENISQGILMVDASGNIPVINQRAIELLRLPASLMQGQPKFRDILDYQLATDEFGPPAEVDPAFLAAVRAGDIAAPFYERVRPDGSVLEVRTQELPNGGAVRTYTDATVRRRNEAALAAARDAAEAGARARAEFIAVMSHEFRTPLNGILGFAELLQGMDLGPTAAEYLAVINDSGAHLLRIINDILDFSRLDASRLDLDESVFDLHDMIRRAVSMLRPQATAKGLELTLDIAGDVPRRVLGDAQRLRQILLNLTGNGLKFTEQGSVRIAVAGCPDAAGDLRLTISVTDTGIGIDAAAQSRLFQAFSQGDSSIRRRFGGSGLGLAITRRLLEMMDGQITVQSAPGAGSTFQANLRLRRAPDVVTAPDESGASQPVPARSWRVLLAEDNPTNRLVATRLLERLGHTVKSVADGRAAVDAVLAGGCDLVLMDMMMPELDGLAATRLIRGLESPAANLPIIGLTANATRADELACRSAGMDSFISKPVRSAQLDAAIRAAMQNPVSTIDT